MSKRDAEKPKRPADDKLVTVVNRSLHLRTIDLTEAVSADDGFGSAAPRHTVQVPAGTKDRVEGTVIPGEAQWWRSDWERVKKHDTGQWLTKRRGHREPILAVVEG